MDPKNDFILGVAPLGAPLVAQTGFGHQKWVPSAPKVFPMIEKKTKHDTKEPPDSEKELQKSSLFGILPGGGSRAPEAPPNPPSPSWSLELLET